jgi:biopolymer transport protein ExbD
MRLEEKEYSNNFGVQIPDILKDFVSLINKGKTFPEELILSIKNENKVYIDDKNYAYKKLLSFVNVLEKKVRFYIIIND